MVARGRKLPNTVHSFAYVIVSRKIPAVSYVSTICDRGVKEYVVFLGKNSFYRPEIVPGTLIDKIRQMRKNLESMDLILNYNFDVSITTTYLVAYFHRGSIHTLFRIRMICPLLIS